ncbi:MAG: DEAD/DEAH box helicase family protein [Acidobacteriota bacterium]|nr:DEAD/DEAH box helicase family protein [Acidobacteriota bacterium]
MERDQIDFPPGFELEAPPVQQADPAALPPGFELEAPPAGQGELPPGFELEAPPVQQADPAALPPGFELEAPPAGQGELPPGFELEMLPAGFSFEPPGAIPPQAELPPGETLLQGAPPPVGVSQPPEVAISPPPPKFSTKAAEFVQPQQLIRLDQDLMPYLAIPPEPTDPKAWMETAAAMQPEEGPVLRAPDQPKSVLQRVQERLFPPPPKPLEVQAREYARGGGFFREALGKPFLGVFGPSVAGKAVRNVTQRLELATHPETYYSPVTGERRKEVFTPQEVKDAAIRMGELGTGNSLADTLLQDIPRFALGGDALIASVPWVGLPLLNLQHQMLDNDMRVTAGEKPQWDMQGLGASAVSGILLRTPLPKWFTPQGGAFQRVAKQLAGAGLRTLELSAAQKAMGQEVTSEDVRNTFALLVGMQLPDMVQQVLAGQAVSQLIKQGLDAKAANTWVTAAMQGDARAQQQVDLYLKDKELAKAWGDAARFREEWREKVQGAERAEALRQKDLAARARKGDKAAQAELARARGIGIEQQPLAARGPAPEARRGTGLLPALPGTDPALAGIRQALAATPPAAGPAVPPLAPVVKPQVRIPPAPAGVVGFRVQAPQVPGKVAEGYYAWLDLDDPQVKAARNINASQLAGLQERNRQRKIYTMSRSRRLQEFAPDRLGESTTSDYGAPMIDAAVGRPVAGYGRMDTLEDVYALDDNDPRKVALKDYSAALAQKVKIGPPPAGMTKPFVARIISSYTGTDAPDFARESNRAVTQTMSESEKSLADAEVISAGNLLAAMNLPESGEITAASNKSFIEGFLAGIDDSSDLFDSRGLLLPEKTEARIQRALLALLLRDDPGVHDSVAALLERAGEYRVKDMLRGITAATPVLARLKATRPEFDLAPEISATMPFILEGKRLVTEGTFPTMELFFSQLDMFKNASPEQRRLALILTQAKSAKQLREALEKYAQMAVQVRKDQLELFTGKPPSTVKIDLLEHISRGMEGFPESLAAGQPPPAAAGIPTTPTPGQPPAPPAEAGIPTTPTPGQPPAGPVGLSQAALDELDALINPPKVGEAATKYGKELPEDTFGAPVVTVRDVPAAYNALFTQPELFPSEKPKTKARQEIEEIAGMELAGPATGDAAGLASRAMIQKAKALITALDEGRITEEEASIRIQLATAKHTRWLARQVPVVLPPPQPDLFLDATKTQGRLLEKPDIYSPFPAQVVEEMTSLKPDTYENQRLIYIYSTEKTAWAIKRLQTARGREWYKEAVERGVSPAEIFTLDPEVTDLIAKGWSAEPFPEIGHMPDFIWERPALRPELRARIEKTAAPTRYSEPGEDYQQLELDFNDYPQRAGEDKVANIKTALEAISEVSGGRVSDPQHPGLPRRLTLTGRGIAYELSLNGVAPLIGHQLNTLAGIQQLVRAARCARLEVFHLLASDRASGQVVLDLPITSRLPGAVHMPRNYDEIAIPIKQLAEELDLEIMAFHNHPSGDVKRTSAEDKQMTVALRQLIGPRMKGALVGDHGKFGYYDPEGNYRIIEDQALAAAPDPLLTPDTPHPLLGAKIGSELQVIQINAAYGQRPKNTILMIGITSPGKVVCLAELQEATLEDNLTRQQATARRLARQTGANSLLAAVTPEQFERYLPTWRQALDNNVLLDVVSTLGRSLRQEMQLPQPGAHRPELTFGMPAHSQRFGEAPADYSQEQEKLLRAGARAVAAAAVESAQKTGQAPALITPEAAQAVLARYGERFAGKYEEIAKLAGNMIQSGEIAVWGEVKQGKIEAADDTKPREKFIPGPGKERTDLIVVNQADIPQPEEIVPRGKYDMSEEQRLGVNAILTRAKKKQRGYLLGDGVGLGKTTEMLAAANELYEQSGGKSKILIVTQAKSILQGSFLDDAKRLKIDLNRFYLATYTGVSGENPVALKHLEQVKPTTHPIAGRKFDVVMMDESHNLKNSLASKTIASKKLVRSAEFIVFATATPMDRPTGAAYFMAEITGLQPDYIANLLGFEIKEKQDPETGEITEVVVPLQGFDWPRIKQNLALMRLGAIKNGAMIRREYPFLGKLERTNVEMPREVAEHEQRMLAYYDQAIRSLPPRSKYRIILSGLRTQAMAHLAEPHKVPEAIRRTKEALAAGQKVIIVVDSVNASERLRRPAPAPGDSDWMIKSKLKLAKIWDAQVGKHYTIPGSATELVKALEAAKIPFASIFGKGDKTTAIDAFQKDKVPVAVMTAKSGGTGVNLDDRVGDKPRTMLVLSMDFSGDVFQQLLGRISRRTTKSNSHAQFLTAPSSFGDQKRIGVLQRKLDVALMAQNGADVDMAAFIPEVEAGRKEMSDLEPAAAPKRGGRRELGTVGPGGEEHADAYGAGWPGPGLGQAGTVEKIPIADDPNYSVVPMELPEVGMLFRVLTGGGWMKIKERFRGNQRGVLGLFRLRAPGEIELKASIFNLVQPDEKERMAQDAEEWAKLNLPATATPEELRAAAGERYKMLFEAQVEKALAEGPLLAAKVAMHEVGHFGDWLPQEMIDGRGNLFGHIAALRNYLKEAMAKTPATPEAALTDRDRRLLRREAERRAGKRPPAGQRDAWKKQVSQHYAELVKRETDRRGMITLGQVKAELKNLILWWRGGGEWQPYYDKPEEMYAEAVSALLNNPAAVHKRAPLFTHLFYEYLEQRPALKREYDAIQEKIKAGTAREDWVRNLRADMEAQDQLLVIQSSLAPTRMERQEEFSMKLDRIFRPYQWRLERLPKDQGGPALGALSDYLYRGAPIERFAARVNSEVVAPSEKLGLNRKDRGEYDFLLRVGYEWRDSTGGRMNLANPWLATPKSARERIEELKRNLGPERFAALEASQKKLSEIWQQEVVGQAREFEILDEALQKWLEDNRVYCTFAAVRGRWNETEDSLQQALNNRLGSGVGNKVYRQIGMTGPIANPESATLLKGAALINWMYKERAKWVAIQAMLNSPYQDLFRQAEKQWTGRRLEFIERDDARIGTIYCIHKGELYAWYAPRFLVDQWNRGNSIMTHSLAQGALQVANDVIASGITAKNPWFWFITNFPRDVGAFNFQMPGTWRRWREYVPGTGGAFGEFALSSFRAAHQQYAGRENALAMLALKRGMVISRSEGYWGEGAETDPFIREMKRRGLDPLDSTRDKELFRVMLDWLKHQGEYGQVLERTVKIAGMQHLDKYQPDMPEWEKRITVRMMSGSPDFLEKGSYTPNIRLAVLFYNAIKEGSRSLWRTARNRPAEFAWNSARRVIWPLALRALVFGGLGMWLAGRKKRNESEEMDLSISESDKMNYLCIPLCWVDRKERKVLYYRHVWAEPERVVAALANSALALAGIGPAQDWKQVAGNLASFAGGQLPGINPMTKMLYDGLILAGGGNPMARGRPMLSRDEAREIGPEDAIKVAQMEWNQSLGGLLGRFDTNPDLPTSGIEKFLRIPLVAASLGRRLKVSNVGYKEYLARSSKSAGDQMAENRLEIDKMMATFKRTRRLQDVLTPEVRVKLAEGAYLLQKYPNQPLPPALAIKRHYAANFLESVKKEEIAKLLPLDLRTSLQAPTSAEKYQRLQTVIEDRR